MSNAKRLFTGLLGTFISMRQTGTTTVLGIAAPKHNLLILAGTADSAEQIKRSEQLESRHIASLLDAETGRLEGRRQPIVLDNYAVIKLCQTALSQFEQDSKRLAQLESDLTIAYQHIEVAKQAYAKEVQGLGQALNTARQQQDEDVRRIHARDIQLDAFQRENLALKIKLAHKTVHHIRVTRKRKR